MKFSYILIRYLANLPFAILIFLSIAIFSIFGSIIEQEQSFDFYKNLYSQPLFGLIDYKLILNLGLDHVFKTWWFISLLLIFGSSLTCCTFLQQLPTLKSVRRIKFYQSTKMLASLPVSKRILFQSDGKIFVSLLPNSYRVFQSFDKTYANKGIVGRISPIVVHFSMVLILIGTILASTKGFIAQELVPESEIFYIQNVLNNNIFSFVPHLSGRINDFWILYNDDSKIRQFYTDFSLLNKEGIEIKRETIYVNHPLKYNGLTFYQTDWNILATRVSYDLSKPYQIPYLKQANNLWITWLPFQIEKLQQFIPKFGSVVWDQTLTETNILFDPNGKFLGINELNESFPNIPNVKFSDLIAETGIQIKSDPGLILIYFGFFLLIISIISSYQSYSQLWILPTWDALFVVGTSNRSKFEFEFEVVNLGFKI